MIRDPSLCFDGKTLVLCIERRIVIVASANLNSFVVIKKKMKCSPSGSSWLSLRDDKIMV